MSSALITLTTDFGSVDSYVAQMKGVIFGINPEAHVVDVTHAIPPQDVVRAAFVLDEIVDAFPMGTIHLVVVDPGVGGARRLLAVEAASQRFVLPDNGLLGVVSGRFAALRSVQLTEDRFWRRSAQRLTGIGSSTEPASTFHGRDILAPVAAHWSRGIQLSEFGRPFDQAIQALPLRQPKRLAGSIVGEVIWIDTFGNLITNIDQSQLPDADRTKMRVSIGRHEIRGIHRFYAERAVGELLNLIGSSGRLEVAVNQGDAAKELRISIKAPVEVSVE